MKYKIGDRVHWNDPDDDICSKDSVIISIRDDTAILSDDTEVFLSELTPIT